MCPTEIGITSLIVSCMALYALQYLKVKVKKEEDNMAVVSKCNETTNIVVVVSVVDDKNVSKDIASFNATLNSADLSFSEQVTVLDKEQCTQYKADVKNQYDAYRANVAAKAQALGYQIF